VEVWKKGGGGVVRLCVLRMCVPTYVCMHPPDHPSASSTTTIHTHPNHNPPNPPTHNPPLASTAEMVANESETNSGCFARNSSSFVAMLASVRGLNVSFDLVVCVRGGNGGGGMGVCVCQGEREIGDCVDEKERYWTGRATSNVCMYIV
jgi:hypothetical protein